MKEWEYRVERIDGYAMAEQVQHALTHLGRCGWQVFQVDRHATFTDIYAKRPRES